MTTSHVEYLAHHWIVLAVPAFLPAVIVVGVVLYIASLWIAGVAQGLMWRATNPDGTLTYSFAQSVNAMYPFYTIRLIGGAMFFAGMLLMAWNVWKTVAAGRAVNDARIPEAVQA